ncbi:hypothetical protein E0F15_11710 [Frankia sp. B2]|nr:hypothetical protein E0F15_11710 [Frankia sp. B2]
MRPLVPSVRPLVPSVRPLVPSVRPLVPSVRPLVPSVRPLVPSVRQRGIRHPIGSGFALLRRISERRHDAPSRISRADGSRNGRTVAASDHTSGHGAPHGALRGSPELPPRK